MTHSPLQYALPMPAGENADDLIGRGFMILTCRGASAADAGVTEKVLVADESFTSRRFMPSDDWSRDAYANRYLVLPNESGTTVGGFWLDFVSLRSRAPFSSAPTDKERTRFSIDSTTGQLMGDGKFLFFDTTSQQLVQRRNAVASTTLLAVRPYWVPTVQASEKESDSTIPAPQVIDLSTMSNPANMAAAAGLVAALGGVAALGANLFAQMQQKQEQTPSQVHPQTPGQSYWYRYARKQ